MDRWREEEEEEGDGGGEERERRGGEGKMSSGDLLSLRMIRSRWDRMTLGCECYCLRPFA